MNARKLMTVLALGLVLGGMVAEDASARAGRSARTGTYSSFGYRGSRSYESHGMQGLSTVRSRPWSTPNYQRSYPSYSSSRPSWFQRHPFLAGVGGALAGSALWSMLGGGVHHYGTYGGYGGGGIGFFGLLFWGAVAFFAFRWLRNRMRPGMAASPAAGGPQILDFDRSGLDGGFRQSREQGLATIALETPGTTPQRLEDDLSAVFFRVQEAWSQGDVVALRQLSEPEVYEEFAGDLAEMQRRGERNVLKNPVMRAFESTEAWTEEGLEFVTVRIQARLIDYVERNGRIVEGSDTRPVDFYEFWTFSRSRGEETWRLSAINQP